jgi:hopanoid biosynthesis associated RND transporter like protein HpnN
MKRQIDAALALRLARWVDGISRHARRVTVGMLLLTLLLSVYTVFNLGINSDNLSLIPARLPSRLAHEAFIEHFPNLEEALFIVIDGETPELAREAAEGLTQRLDEAGQYFTDAYMPGGGEFFEQNGLLYRSTEDLDVFADEMARIQPLIAELEVDASVAHMAEIVRIGLGELEEGDAGEAQWAMVLDRVSEATVKVYDAYPIAVSWEEVLLQGSSLDVTTRRIIVAHPILDYGDILQGRRPINEIRDFAEALGYTPERGVTLRITGNPALNYDEMIGFAWDIGGAGLFCFALVTFILFRALRSIKLVVASLATLLVGLIWTAAFTAMTIGQLNLLTISFAILFIGLGVDFAIHLGIAYANLLRGGESHQEAIRDAVTHIGSSLLFCTISTAIGFYVFVPTQYRGVSELGLIAGSSMFIIFFLTLTLTPALLSDWLALDPTRQQGRQLRFGSGWWDGLGRHPAAVRWLALVAAIVSALLIPSLRFDSNVVEMRDPSTQSVQAFQDLLEKAETSPWYLNTLMPDLESAEALGEQVDDLPEVDYTLTLASFVPDDQDEKLEILGDVAYIFEPPVGAPVRDAPPTIDEQVDALRELYEFLGSPVLQQSEQPLARSMQRLREHLRHFLERAQQDGQPEEALAELERVLLEPLPAQLARLRRALEAEEITLDGLPDEIREHMVTKDGVARLQIFPANNLRTIEGLRGFVESVQAVTPNVAGVPLNLIEFGNITSASFRQALISAIVLISLLLYLLWRSFVDVILVMVPLLLGALMTAATAAALGMSFNFTNVVVIPLLLGIGVDSGIHLVQRAKDGLDDERGLMATPTARAVYYSALTSIMSFGSMSFAGHNGLQSLGILLTVGLIYTVASVLIVLPALLDLRK